MLGTDILLGRSEKGTKGSGWEETRENLISVISFEEKWKHTMHSSTQKSTHSMKWKHLTQILSLPNPNCTMIYKTTVQSHRFHVPFYSGFSFAPSKCQ